MDETMSLSDTNVPSDGPEASLTSLLKLSYERSSSPEFTYDSSSSSSSELRSPSPHPRSPSPESNRSSLPTSFMNEDPPSPQSPMSVSSCSTDDAHSQMDYPMSPEEEDFPQRTPIQYYEACHPPQSSSYTPPPPFAGFSPASPPQPALNSPSRSPHFHPHSLSPSNYPSPLSPLLPTSPLLPNSPLLPTSNTNSRSATIPTPSPQSPSTSSQPLSLSPQPPSTSPHSPSTSSQSSSHNPTQYLAVGRSFSTLYMKSFPNLPDSEASHSRSGTTDEGPPRSTPFYSFSPKLERDTKSPFLRALASASASSSSSVTTNTTNTTTTTLTATPTTTTTTATTSASVSEDAPVEEDEEPPPPPRPVAPSTPPPEEVVVDLDQGPPCVVDLTCEEDDDEVEIVSTDQPVVFLSESSLPRRRRKRRRHASQAVDASSSAGGVEEPIVISDTLPDSPGDTPATAIDVSDSPVITLRPSPGSSTGGASSSSAGPRNPPQLFGDLLNQSVVPLDPEGGLPSRVVCTCVLGEGGSGPTALGHASVGYYAAGYCALHGLRNVERVPRGDRSRSPLQEEAGSRSVMEAPIPQDVLEDIASLYAENTPPPSLFRRIMMGADVGDDLLERKMRYGSRYRLPRPPPPPPQTFSDLALNPLSVLSQAAASSSSSSHHEVPPPPPPPPSSVADGGGSSSGEEGGGLSCPICFESFQEIKKEGKSLSSTVCGHIFCTQCLEASFKQAKQCPTCRKRLNKKQYHRLYI